MKCENCGKTIEKDSVYCEHCGNKIELKMQSLQQSEVRKNIFGLLSVYTFLITLVIFTLMPIILSMLNISTSGLTLIGCMGYLLSIIFGVIGIVICKKDRTIDMCASGLNYGSATTMFSIFMLIAKAAKV